MDDATPGAGSGSAVRALAAASAEVAALRAGRLEPEEARAHILRVANAVERSLRRLLRDDERADLSIRLKALAPDELRRDAVLAELRRNERLSMDMAASVHELLEVRRRLEKGSPPEVGDADRAVRVVDALERELRRPIAPAAAAAPIIVEPSGDEPLEIGITPRRRRRGGVPGVAIAGGAIVVALALLAYWLQTGRGPNGMDQGIALFRTGDYAEAAQHFFRYSQANPEDATPHLYLARIHRRMQRPELAADAIREALRLAPEDPAVHRETAFFLIDQGQPDVAVDRFREAIEMEPESTEGWVGLVRALRAANRGAEVDSVIAEAPAEARALLNTGSSN